MAAIELLLERNRAGAKPFASSSWPKLCVVTCDDAALTGQLEQALGLAAGDAVVIRLPAGGGALSLDVVQRAVAKAVFVDGCDEALVLSHSSCTLYGLSASKLIEGLQRHNVPRTAIPMDLRELVGAGHDPRETVRITADALRKCAYLPESFLVHLGHLEETTGELVLVEHGEKYRISRTVTASQGGVAGYSAGPSQMTEAPVAASLPGIEGMSVQQLTAPSVPDIRPFEMQAISVTLPSLTQQMSGPGDLASGASHTAQSLHGGDSTAKMSNPMLTQAMFADPVQAAPAKGESSRAAKQAQRQKQKGNNAVRRQGGENPAPLKPQLVDAIQKIRTFMGNEIAKPDRREAQEQISEALRNGAGTEELVKISLRPVLQAGQSRYKVIDEMILVKEELVRLPPFQAAELLRQMVP